MPEKINTNPSPGLLQRLLGSDSMTPDMQQGINIAKRENPNLGEVQPYGILSRLLQPNAQGYTGPNRTIYLNPKTMAADRPQEVADTLLHEQTHVNQMKERGHGTIGEILSTIYNGLKNNEPYAQRPDEIQAFQAERERRARMGRMQSAEPSFTTGEMIVPQDIMLPRKKLNQINTGPSFKVGGK